MNNAQWGKVNDVYVPSITYKTLNLTNTIHFNLGYYKDGFWVQINTKSLPFLVQSYKNR